MRLPGGRSTGTWSRQWRDRDDVQRLILYTRMSGAVVWFFVPLSALAARPADGPAGAGWSAAAAALLVLTVFCVLLVDRDVKGTPRPRHSGALWAVGVLAATGLAVVGTVAPGRGALLTTIAAVGLAPAGIWGPRRYLPLALVAGVTATLLAGLPLNPGAAAFGVVVATASAFIAGTVQFSLWMCQVVRRLASAERDRARLAVAEERLRFARDLHDVVGRDLSAIAVTSDLVAELARRGRPEVVERAEEVRRIAHDSLREVRAVVRGYRQVDLADELDGSAALLQSAGVRCTVAAQPDELPPDARVAAAWVVREGVTNVLRHSSATWCRIAVARQPGGESLEVRLDNDGVAAGAAAAGHGSGLAGLAERLRPLGGEIATECGDGTFSLRAQLPAPAAAAGSPASAMVSASAVEFR